jgi:3-hydroxyacyl-[acyl-carrier-protein] dehydratase
MEEEALKAALTALPHGPEFRFVDRLTQLDPRKRGAGEYRVRPESEFLRGHFPNAPMMPGVLLLEALAQLAGIVAQSDPARAPLKDLRLTALRAVKILGTAIPGDTIRMQASVDGRLGNLVQASGDAWVGDRLVLQASLALSGVAPGDS